MTFLALVACFGSRPTEFPSGLEPLVPNDAVFPDGAGGGRATEDSVDVVVGRGDAWDFANARGYLTVPLADVWVALKSPDTVVDRRAVDSYTVDHLDDPAYDVSFIVHTHVVDLVTIDYDQTWRQSQVDDDVVAARWQKTDGSSLVETLEGSVVLTSVDDDLTSVEIVEHLKATGDQTSRLQSYFDDLWASLAAASHGDPLPTYE